MKPTVAHVRDIYLPLTETWLYGYLRALANYRPIVLARRTRNLDHFPLTTLYTPSQHESRLGWQLWDSFWRFAVAQAGVMPPQYDTRRNFFTKTILREKAVLIHAHFGQEGFRMLPVRRDTGLPLVTSFYGYDISLLPRRFPWLWPIHYRRLFEEGTLFLIEGNHMKQSLIELGCPPEKIEIQHIGVDVDQFSYAPRRLTGEKITLLSCASFIEKKGLIYALQALGQIVQEHPNIEYKIIGGGTLEKPLKKFVEENGLGRYVTWLGYQPHHAFRSELHNAHIFVQPSVTASNGDSEGGAPTTLLEAQATGTPVLATHHADIPEVVLEGQSGYLAPERDADALAEGLRALIERSDNWPEMGLAGRRHMEQEYDIKTEATKLENIYQKVITS